MAAFERASKTASIKRATSLRQRADPCGAASASCLSWALLLQLITFFFNFHPSLDSVFWAAALFFGRYRNAGGSIRKSIENCVDGKKISLRLRADPCGAASASCLSWALQLRNFFFQFSPLPGLSIWASGVKFLDDIETPVAAFERASKTASIKRATSLRLRADPCGAASASCLSWFS